MGRSVAAAVVAVGLLGCAGGLRAGVFTRDGLAYRVAAPPEPAWRPVSFEDNDLAWLAPGSGHVLALSATCVGHEDPPLEVLTTHRLIGFTERQVVQKAVVQLDGRDALRTLHHAKLDGVPVSLELVVLKKNGCVHDFAYVSPRGQEAAQQAAFEALLAGFRQERAP